MARIKKAQAGLKASNKRVGPIDPKGAWTKVQEENLPPKNKKTSVSLTKDKELGATKMAKDGKWIQKAVKTMRKDKPCTGPKFGSKTCPPGSKRYNLAKTFKAMGKARKAK